MPSYPFTAPEVFIVGCGDIGLRVAALEQAAGRVVGALCRDLAKLQGRGIQLVAGDLDVPASLSALPEAVEVLYYLAPPPGFGVSDPRLQALLAAWPQNGLPKRVVYISTSGVYGDCDGAWVDEAWPLNPRSERGKRRAAAEICLQQWAEGRGVQLTVLRVPGIYGPGRWPLERLRRGTPVLRQAESPYSNRIHADDLALVCFLAGQPERPTGIYNVSDGNPSTMTDYFYQVADAFGLPRPPAISMAEAREQLGPGILSFLEESKRLDNRKLLQSFGLQLRYPDLATALAEIKREEP